MSPLNANLVARLKSARCYKKKQITSFAAAVCILLTSRIHQNDLTCHVYRCGFGAHWHLGRKNASNNQFCDNVPCIARTALPDYPVQNEVSIVRISLLPAARSDHRWSTLLRNKLSECVAHVLDFCHVEVCLPYGT